MTLGSGQWGVGSGKWAGSRRRFPAAWLVVAFLLAVPIFGHGCHRGDHDEEPLFVPPPPRAGEVAPPR